jgi:hypothetical protein
MIKAHKASFENGLNAVVMLQEHTVKAVDNVMKQLPWIPAESLSLMNDWHGIYKKCTGDFKEAARENYSRLEKMLTSGADIFQATKQ